MAEPIGELRARPGSVDDVAIVIRQREEAHAGEPRIIAMHADPRLQAIGVKLDPACVENGALDLERRVRIDADMPLIGHRVDLVGVTARFDHPPAFEVLRKPPLIVLSAMKTWELAWIAWMTPPVLSTLVR